MKRNKPSAKLNYIYNLIYQFLLIIAPLVTTPYISRVLGSAEIGKFSFASSITNFFVVFAYLGFQYYAQRSIATCRDDRKKQSIMFWEIFMLKAINSIIILIAYGVFLSFSTQSDYFILFIILLPNILTVCLDISYLYQGNEMFGILALRNSVVKIIVVGLIFVFVRDQGDLAAYAILNVLAIFFSTASLWVAARKLIDKVAIRELNLKRHAVPSLKLFAPAIALSFLSTINKTMIGFLVEGETILGSSEVVRNSDIQNGIFEQAHKVYTLGVLFLTSLGTVMIPRNAKDFSEGKIDVLNRNINKAISFTFFFGLPISLGFIAIASNLAGWFYGPGFDGIILVIIALAPKILIEGMNNLLGIQLFLPQKKDKQYSFFIILGVVLNVALAIPLIINFGALGAAIAATISEFIVLIVVLIYLKKKENFSFTFPLKYLIISILMFAVVYSVQFLLKSSIVNTLVLVLIGSIVYLGILLLFKDKIAKELLYFVVKLFKKNKKQNIDKQ